MKTIKVAKPSLQSLLITMMVAGNKLSTGTGFVCLGKSGNPVLITNWHNLSGLHHQTRQPLSPTGGIPDAISIMHHRDAQLGNWVSHFEGLRHPLLGNTWKEHPTLGDRADFVALPLTRLFNVKLYPYDIVTPLDISLRTADPVSVVGFPFGLTGGGGLGVWATGFVASEPMIDFQGMPTFLIDCRTRAGQSGSAVIYQNNGGLVRKSDGMQEMLPETTRLLGVYSGRVNAESDLGIVWKASAIQQLLDSV